MKYLLTLIFCSSWTVFGATLHVDPGTWKFDSTVNVNGKSVDVDAVLKEAMAKLTPEQKKQFQETLAAASKGHGGEFKNLDSLMNKEVCITPEMVQKGQLTPESPKECTNRIIENSKSKISGQYKCKGKVQGTYEVTTLSPKNFKGKMKSVDEQGNKINVDFTAHQLSKECKK